MCETDYLRHRRSNMARRIYSIDMRTFENTLTQTPVAMPPSWTIESVKETSDGDRDLAIPGMYNVVAAAEDVALARACDGIDKWLMANRAVLRGWRRSHF
jgi:hypothetical protein